METKKHKAYRTVKLLIEANQINTFREIFEYIPRTVVGKDLKIPFTRFKNMISQVEDIKLAKIYALAHLIGVDEKLVLDLAHNQHAADKRKKTRKKLPFK